MIQEEDDMGLLDLLFGGYDRDGEDDDIEMMAELQMTARSRREAIELTGDDTFYMGDDDADDFD